MLVGDPLPFTTDTPNIMLVHVEYARVLETMWLIHYLFCFTASQLKATCTTPAASAENPNPFRYGHPPTSHSLIFYTASS